MLLDLNTYFMPSCAQNTIIRVVEFFLLVIRVGRSHIAMPYYLLCLLVAENLLCGRQQTTQSNLTKLLFFQELRNVHPHA